MIKLYYVPTQDTVLSVNFNGVGGGGRVSYLIYESFRNDKIRNFMDMMMSFSYLLLSLYIASHDDKISFKKCHSHISNQRNKFFKRDLQQT